MGVVSSLLINDSKWWTVPSHSMSKVKQRRCPVVHWVWGGGNGRRQQGMPARRVGGRVNTFPWSVIDLGRQTNRQRQKQRGRSNNMCRNTTLRL